MSYPLPQSGKTPGGWAGQSYYLVVSASMTGLSGSGAQELSFPVSLPSGTIGPSDTGHGWVYVGAYAKLRVAPSGSGIGSVTASLGFDAAPQTMLLNHIMTAASSTGSLWSKLSGTGTLPVGTFQSGQAPIVTVRAADATGTDAWANDVTRFEMDFRLDVIPVFKE